MRTHLRHQRLLRAALVILAVLLVVTNWSADLAANVFLIVWALAAVAGALGHTFPGWSQAERHARTSRLPLGAQGVLLGLAVGAFLVLLTQGVPPAFGGLLIALAGVYDDLLRQAWRHLPRDASADDADALPTAEDSERPG